jgi:type III secretion system FlhB-like substrate exporter
LPVFFWCISRPSIDLVEAASEAETVISSLRKIRQDDNVWQELYQDIANLLFFFVHQEHLIALYLPVVTWF